MKAILALLALVSLAACAQNSGSATGSGNRGTNTPQGETDPAGNGGATTDPGQLTGRWTTAPIQQEGSDAVVIVSLNIRGGTMDFTLNCQGQGQNVSPTVQVPIRVTGNRLEILESREASAPFMGGQCPASVEASTVTWQIQGDRLTVRDQTGETLDFQRVR